MRKVLLTLGMGLMLALVLTACGPEPEVSSSSVASSTASSVVSSTTSSTVSSVVSSVASSVVSSVASSATSSIASSVASTNATLVSLTVDKGSLNPAYNVLTSMYTLNLLYTEDTLVVTAVASNSNATVSGNIGTNSIGTGSTNLTIIVVAEDTSVTNAYIVSVTRALPSSDANLSDLTIEGSTIVGFSSNTTTYSYGPVPYDQSTIAIVGTPSDANASVFYTGTNLGSAGTTNDATVIVVAQDGVTTNTYIISVGRTAAPADDATLTSLTVDGTSVAGFAPTTLAYTNNVAYSSTASVQVVATPTSSAATVSGAITNTMTLSVGYNTTNLVVTAGDGTTTKTYSLTVVMAAPSTDATLYDLTIDGTTVSGFAPATLAYTNSPNLTNSTVTLAATVNDTNATIAPAASFAWTVSVGTNTTNFTVTAEDGVTTKSYTVVIICDKMHVTLKFANVTAGAPYIFLTGDQVYLHKDGVSTWAPDKGLLGVVSAGSASISFDVPVADFGATISWKPVLGTGWSYEQFSANESLVVTDPATNISYDWSSVSLANAGVLYDGVGTVSFDSTTYDIASGTKTVNVTVFDASTNVTSLMVNVSNTNSAVNLDVVLTNTNGAYTYEGSLTVNTSGADLAAANNDVITVNYADVDPAGTNTANATVLFVPSYTVDGLVSSEYSLLGTGGGSSWGATVGNVYVTSTTNTLFVAVQFSILPDANNIYIVVDDTNLASGLTTLGDFTSGWGDVGLSNTLAIEPDFATWGWCGSDGTLTWSGANKIVTNTGTAATGVTQAQDISGTPGTYEFAVPYSQIGSGSSAGDTVGIYVFFGKDAASGGIHSSYPVMVTDNPCTNVTTASSNYTLQ